MTRIWATLIFISLLIIVGCSGPEYDPMEWRTLVLPTSETITGIFFVSEDYGYAVTESGSILKTTDQGETFTILEYHPGVRLEDAWFDSKEKGFIFGAEGLLAHTADGGQTWQTIATDPTYHLYDMNFLDGEHGFLAGVITSAGLENRGVIGFSGDQGATWSFDTTQFDGLRHVDVLETSHAWIGGQGVIVYTIDQGETWEHNATGDLNDNVRGVFFSAMQYGHVVAERGVILNTDDGGWSWQRVEKFTDRDFACVTAPEVNVVYIAGDGIVARSTSRGKTWEVDSTSYSAYFDDIHWEDDWVYLAGSNGTMLKLVK
ncbi:MAG: YCF48-related protein [bacterium]